MIDSNEQIVHSTCIGRTNKSDKDLFRICPSKLNKKELEDLYFAVSENNIQLKKTINSQREQIKILNTKVQRLTQKNIINSNKEYCPGSKVVINEQKETIADLKKSNERLSDRIRLLNMRLCSAKQFLRRSPQSSYCAKCFSSNTCIKNLSTSALNSKRSEIDLRTAITSSQSLDKANVRNKTTRNIFTQVDILLQDESCQQNKCRTTMEELTQNITDLKEELSKTHKEYANRLCKLEEEINTVREENIRIRAEHSNTEQKLEAKDKENANILQKLRDAESLYDDVTAQLIIERSKVSELEMQLKATDISKQVAKALETQMKSSFLIPIPTKLSSSAVKEILDKSATNSDDSGYTEGIIQEHDKKDLVKQDQNVIQQIMSLQAEVDSLKRLMDEQNRSASERNSENVISNEKGVCPSSNLTNETFVSHIKLDKQSLSTLTINHNKVSEEDVNNQNKIVTGESKINTKIPIPINKMKFKQNEELTKKVLGHSINNEKNSIHSDINEGDKVDLSIVTNNENIKKADLKSSKNHELNDQNLDNKEKTEGNAELEVNNTDEEDVVARNASKKTDNPVSKNKSSDNNSSGNNTFIIETKPNNEVNKKPSSDKVTKQTDANVNLGQSSDIKDEVRVSKPLATSSPSHHTYTVDKSADVRATSPDNTECEISSLTELPNELEDKSPTDYISPGEERMTSSYSDSYPTTTTDYYLSEGELPITNVRNLSLAEVVVKNKPSHPIGRQTVTEMEDAIQAINEEMNRCRDLLQGRRQVIIPTVGRVHTFSYPYNYTINLE